MVSGQRPSWDDYFLRMALLVATRATCLRRRVGAVMVRDRRVIATGYNGSVRGDVHCEDVGCLMAAGHCIRCVHAELNALLQCASSTQHSVGATLYSTDFPCVHCAKALMQAEVAKVVYLAEYPDENSAAILRQGGVALFRAMEEGGRYHLSEEI